MTYIPHTGQVRDSFYIDDNQFAIRWSTGMVLTSSMQSLVVADVASAGQPSSLQFTIIYVPQV